MRIKEFATLTGVTVRTLHYYHQIGLLKPAFTDEITGYRYYDAQSLLRMQEILFYRELDFPLQRIGDSGILAVICLKCRVDKGRITEPKAPHLLNPVVRLLVSQTLEFPISFHGHAPADAWDNLAAHPRQVDGDLPGALTAGAAQDPVGIDIGIPILGDALCQSIQ